MTKEELVKNIKAMLEDLQRRINLSYESGSGISRGEQAYIQGQRDGLKVVLFELENNLN